MKNVHSFSEFVNSINEAAMPYQFITMNIRDPRKGTFEGEPGKTDDAVIFSSRGLLMELTAGRYGPMRKQLENTFAVAGVPSLNYYHTDDKKEVAVYGSVEALKMWLQAAYLSHPNADIRKEGEDLLKQF